MAEIFTDKLKLTKRDTGDLNWGAGHNANLDLLDAHAQQGTLRPPRTLLATLGSGAVGSELLGNTIYFYKVTAINDAGETTENKVPSVLEAQVSQPVIPLPVILQWEIVKGAVGYRIYKSTSSGTEKFLAEVTGESTTNYTDTGNTATNGVISVPASNTARTSVRKIIGGSGISVSPSDGTGDVTIESTASAGVVGIRKLGNGTTLVGDVKLEGTGIVTITQDDANNKIQIGATGGGASGYASAVVAAPTGVAATDTANIQTSLNAVGSLGGGIVQLREGTYVINATLSMPSRTTLQGQGVHGTTIRADNAMDYIGMISASGYNTLRDVTIDANMPGRPAGNCNTEIDFSGGNNPMLIENILYTNNYGFNIMIKLSTKGVLRNSRIFNNGVYIADSIVWLGEQVEGCYFQRDQINSLNNIIYNVKRVINNQYVTTVGSLSGSGIVLQSLGVAVGNVFQVTSGKNFITVTGNQASIVGNVGNGGTILLNSGASSNVVVGNAYVIVTNNSGNGTNQIANNS